MKAKLIAVVIWTAILTLVAIFAFGVENDAILTEFDSDIARLGDRQHEIELAIAEMRVQITALQSRIDGLYGIIDAAKWAMMFVGVAGVPLGLHLHQRHRHRQER